MGAIRHRTLTPAARIAVIYALVSALWILLSDALLGFFIPSQQLGVRISIIKGWGFVATTALILFFLVKDEFARRERMSQALEVYRAVAENSHDIVLIVQEGSGRIVGANRAAVQAYGYESEELLQKTILDLRHPSTLAVVDAQLQQASGPGVRFETIHVRRDGSPFPVEVGAQGVTVGRERQLFSIIRDISERKQAESEIERQAALEALRESEGRYRSLFENMLEGFAYCRMFYENDRPVDFIYLDVNSAFGKLTGLQDVIGRKVSDVIPGIREANPELFETYGRVALLGRPETLEVYLEALGIWLHISIYCPEKEHFVAVFDNITTRKQAEAEQRRLAEERDGLLARLQDLNADLEQRVRQRTAELTVTQEQLRQREASLRALVQRRAEAQERERAYVADQLYNEAAQVLAVVQIQQSRLAQQLAHGQASPELWADLKGAVDRVLSELHHLAVHLRPATLDQLGLVPALQQYLAEFGREHGLHVEFEAVGMDGTRVPTEMETALYRIVQEALANVAQHAQARSVNILVRRSPGHLSVMVEDDGIGFDVDEALRRGPLGLLGMRERAEALNGCLDVESGGQGTGTTIFVEVPWIASPDGSGPSAEL